MLGAGGHLKFHQARVSRAAMRRKHPMDGRSLSQRHPRLDRRPWRDQADAGGYWTLSASELWQMGYRKCSN